MKIKVIISAVIFLMLCGCKVAMQPSGELKNTSYTIVEQDGKSVWLIYQDSIGNNYEENGVHKIKYSSYRFLQKRKMTIEFYNLKGYYLDSGSVVKVQEVWKKNKLIEQSFYDSTDNLIKPDYLNYARMSQKHYKNGSWRVRYYNEKNKPYCLNDVIEQTIIWDTIWQVTELDTNYLLMTKILDSKKCK